METGGINEILLAFAAYLAKATGMPVECRVFQANFAGHTRANAPVRFVRPALFEGPVNAGHNYIMVDDHLGLGGTLARLKGHVEKQGGRIVGAVTLTSSRNNQILGLKTETLEGLRIRHGDSNIEAWWEGRFGHGFECLTDPEAGYLERIPVVDIIRERLTQAECEEMAEADTRANQRALKRRRNQSSGYDMKR